MGIVKKTTDFLVGFAAFCGFIYVFSKFQAYKFTEQEGIVEKLKFFFSNQNYNDYSPYIALILLLAFSCAFSLILHKLPYLTLPVAALPLIQTTAMIAREKIYEYPMLYLFISGLHLLGCFYECVRRDREDNGRRAALGTDLLAVTVSLFCIYILYSASKMQDADITKLNFLQRCIYYNYETLELSVFKYLAVAFSALPAVRLLHRDIYFIDALISPAPLVYMIYKWGITGEFPIFGEVLTALSLAYTAARISIMLLCKSKPIKNRQKSKDFLKSC